MILESACRFTERDRILTDVAFNLSISFGVTILTVLGLVIHKHRTPFIYLGF